MNNGHLSEEEIQVFVFDPENIDAGVIAHIQGCPECLELVNIYELMLADVAMQEVPAFDFDVASVVLANIQQAGTTDDPARVFPHMTLILAAVFVMVPLYIFRANFLIIANTTSVIFLLISSIACIIGFIFKAMQLYGRYKAQIKTIGMA
jgi:hypothetical protein